MNLSRWTLTIIELSLGVFENVARDTGFVRTFGDTVFQHVQKEGQVLVATSPEFLGLVVHLGQDTQQRNVILPVVGRAAEIGHAALDVTDFLQQLVIDVAFDAEAVVKCQTGVEGKPLEVRGRVHVQGAVLAVAVQFLDAGVGLKVDDGHIGLCRRSIQGRGSGLATSLAGFIPRRSADGEALGAGDDAVESVEGRSRDQGRLILNPQLTHRVEAVGKYDALSGVQSTYVRFTLSGASYLISHAHLEDRAELLRPLARDHRVLVSELQQVAEEGHAGDFRQPLDLGYICTVEVADEQVDDRDHRDGKRLERHGYYFDKNKLEAKDGVKYTVFNERRFSGTNIMQWLLAAYI